MFTVPRPVHLQGNQSKAPWVLPSFRNRKRFRGSELPEPTTTSIKVCCPIEGMSFDGETRIHVVRNNRYDKIVVSAGGEVTLTRGIDVSASTDEVRTT